MCDGNSLHNIRESGEKSDFSIFIDGRHFRLHKFPLYLKCEHFKKSDFDEVNLDKFPGGTMTFSLVADFCYGKCIVFTLANIVSLRCAADYLGMFGNNNLIRLTDEYIDDLLSSAYLNGTISHILEMLSQCIELGSIAARVKIVEKCLLTALEMYPIPCRRYFKPDVVVNDVPGTDLILDRVERLPLPYVISFIKQCNSRKHLWTELAHFIHDYLYRIFKICGLRLEERNAKMSRKSKRNGYGRENLSSDSGKEKPEQNKIINSTNTKDKSSPENEYNNHKKSFATEKSKVDKEISKKHRKSSHVQPNKPETDEKNPINSLQRKHSKNKKSAHAEDVDYGDTFQKGKRPLDNNLGDISLLSDDNHTKGGDFANDTLQAFSFSLVDESKQPNAHTENQVNKETDEARKRRLTANDRIFSKEGLNKTHEEGKPHKQPSVDKKSYNDKNNVTHGIKENKGSEKDLTVNPTNKDTKTINEYKRDENKATRASSVFLKNDETAKNESRFIDLNHPSGKKQPRASVAQVKEMSNRRKSMNLNEKNTPLNNSKEVHFEHNDTETNKKSSSNKKKNINNEKTSKSKDTKDRREFQAKTNPKGKANDNKRISTRTASPASDRERLSNSDLASNSARMKSTSGTPADINKYSPFLTEKKFGNLSPSQRTKTPTTTPVDASSKKSEKEYAYGKVSPITKGKYSPRGYPYDRTSSENRARMGENFKKNSPSLKRERDNSKIIEENDEDINNNFVPFASKYNPNSNKLISDNKLFDVLTNTFSSELLEESEHQELFFNKPDPSIFIRQEFRQIYEMDEANKYNTDCGISSISMNTFKSRDQNAKNISSFVETCNKETYNSFAAQKFPTYSSEKIFCKTPINICKRTTKLLKPKLSKNINEKQCKTPHPHKIRIETPGASICEMETPFSVSGNTLLTDINQYVKTIPVSEDEEKNRTLPQPFWGSETKRSACLEIVVTPIPSENTVFENRVNESLLTSIPARVALRKTRRFEIENSCLSHPTEIDTPVNQKVNQICRYNTINQSHNNRSGHRVSNVFTVEDEQSHLPCKHNYPKKACSHVVYVEVLPKLSPQSSGKLHLNNRNYVLDAPIKLKNDLPKTSKLPPCRTTKLIGKNTSNVMLKIRDNKRNLTCTYVNQTLSKGDPLCKTLTKKVSYISSSQEKTSSTLSFIKFKNRNNVLNHEEKIEPFNKHAQMENYTLSSQSPRKYLKEQTKTKRGSQKRRKSPNENTDTITTLTLQTCNSAAPDMKEIFVDFTDTTYSPPMITSPVPPTFVNRNNHARRKTSSDNGNSSGSDSEKSVTKEIVSIHQLTPGEILDAVVKVLPDKRLLHHTVTGKWLKLAMLIARHYKCESWDYLLFVGGEILFEFTLEELFDIPANLMVPIIVRALGLHSTNARIFSEFFVRYIKDGVLHEVFTAKEFIEFITAVPVLLRPEPDDMFMLVERMLHKGELPL